MNVIRESVLVLEGELQGLRRELMQPAPPQQPRPAHVQVPPGSPDEFADPDATPASRPNQQENEDWRSPEPGRFSEYDLWHLSRHVAEDVGTGSKGDGRKTRLQVRVHRKGSTKKKQFVSLAPFFF